MIMCCFQMRSERTRGRDQGILGFFPLGFHPVTGTVAH